MKEICKFALKVISLNNILLITLKLIYNYLIYFKYLFTMQDRKRYKINLLRFVKDSVTFILLILVIINYIKYNNRKEVIVNVT